MKKLWGLFVAILITPLLTFCHPVSASAQDFYFKDATFDYYLEKTETGSKMHVKETLVAVFPDSNQNHGITRYIPYTNQGGSNLTAPDKSSLNFTVKRNGAKEEIAKSDSEKGSYIFYVGNANSYVHGEQTYEIEYDFQNVITEFDSSGAMTWQNENAVKQELYWDTNGTGWNQKFNKLTANLHLPADIAKNLTSGTSCYVGYQGTSNENHANISSRCTVSSNDETTYNSSALNSTTGNQAETIITFETTSLSPRENLTFAVNFRPGTFNVPAPQKDYSLFIISCLSLVAALFSIIFAIYYYIKLTKEKRHYAKSHFVKPEYEPPKNLSVAESSEISIKPTSAKFTATILEMAVNHNIAIINDSENKKDWSIKLISESSLTDFQKDALKILNGGAMPEIEEVFAVKRQSYSSTVHAITKRYHDEIISALKSKKLLLPEKVTKSLPTTLLILPTFIIAFVWGFMLALKSDLPDDILYGGLFIVFAPFASLFVSLIITIILSTKASVYTKRTIEGIEASKHIEGLKLYIKMAEADRLRFLQSVKGAPRDGQGIVKIYEKLLPYACIFGLEKSWLKELEKYYQEYPDYEHDWYSGRNLWLLYSFNSRVSTSYNSVSVNPASSSSSSSSGGGGGGFSGGGGGGGGGGGW